MSTRHFTNRFGHGSLESSEIEKPEIAKRAYDLLMNCTKHQPPVHDNHDGGLYVGFIGHAYALLHLSKSSMLSSQRTQMLNHAKYLIEQDLLFYTHVKRMGDDIALSFLLGRLGTLAVAGCVYDQLGQVSEAKQHISEFIKIGERFLDKNVLKSGSDELFVGRAGYISALFMLRANTKPTTMNFPKDLLYKILNTIIQSGQQYSQKHNSRCTLMYAYYGTEYLGAGHGLVGILMVLMKSREYLQDHSVVVSIIQECIHYLISKTGSDGNLAPAVEDLGRSTSEDSQLVHWCHGAAGAVYVYARAYVLWKDESYLKAALNCGEVVWKYGLLKKGPGICHGVAGSGYVFLALYRLTGDTHHLYRARCFFDFIWTSEFKSEARVPDAPYSLFEGWAGTACFMSDLANPNNSHFPFFDVFE